MWKDKELEKDWKKSKQQIMWMAIIISSLCIGLMCSVGKAWVSILCAGINILIWTIATESLLENYQCRQSIDK